MVRRMVQGIPVSLLEYLGRFLLGNSTKAALRDEPTQGAPPRFAGVIDRAGPAKPMGCSLGAVGGCCEFLALQFSAQDAATSIKLFETPIIGAHAPAQRHSV